MLLGFWGDILITCAVEGLSLELFIIKQAEATYRGLFLVRPLLKTTIKQGGKLV